MKLTRIALFLTIAFITLTNTGCSKEPEQKTKQGKVEKELLLLEEGFRVPTRKEIKSYDIDDKNGTLWVLTTSGESYHFSNYIVKEKVAGENIGSVIIEVKLQPESRIDD